MINVYKEAGYTSHDVVARLRGICKQKRIGHTGTLDPDAVGVLPVCLGNGTRLCDMLQERDKEYIADFRLGITTDTQDISGTVLAEKNADMNAEEVERAAAFFVGEYLQLPPMYSALKVNGKKLCDLARAGIEVERKPREITVFSIRVLKEELPEVQMQVHCSKGTYIRTLCHDIGQKLGCGGCMKSLLRTRVAEFELKDAVRLAEIEAQVQAVRGREPQKELTGADLPGLVKNTDCVFLQYPCSAVKGEFSRLLYNGNALKPEWLTEWHKEYQQTILRLYDENQLFAGIYRWDEKRKELKPVRIFMDLS